MSARGSYDRSCIQRGRRAFLLGAAAFAVAPAAIAQTPARRPLIGWLGTSTQPLAAAFIGGFAKGMGELGRVEGRDYEMVYRFADGQLERIPTLAEEIVQAKPTLIVVGGTPAAIALHKATTTIPIVAATFSDPVGFGLIATQARPGGNVTGLINYVETLPGKLLALAKEVKPDAKRFGLVLNLTTPQYEIYRRDANAAAETLGVALAMVEVRTAADLEGAFQRLREVQADIALFFQDSLFVSERSRLAKLAAAARMPALYSFREHVEEGGLMSYGQNLAENYHRVATYVDKILKGAKPGDLPVEFPTSFELAINLKTAKALGLEIPPLLLARADVVVE
jgi:putative tryptophan/tyrosine transport system substrate-binding protein